MIQLCRTANKSRVFLKWDHPEALPCWSLNSLLICSHKGKQYLGIGRCCQRSMALPYLVLMRVAVVTDPSYHQTRYLIHNSGSLHFEAEDFMFLCYSIAGF